MKITTLGIDLAKNVFQLHGVNEHGREVLKKQLKRDQMLAFFVNLAPCLIGMDACGGSHHWARKLHGMGHTVRLMAPQFVKPYVKSNKNDAADAQAICEAVARPTMRFVAVKNIEQQTTLAVHRARQSFVKARTAQGNQIRGLLSEFGLIVPQGLANVFKRVPVLLEDSAGALTGTFKQLIERLMDNLKHLDRQVQELEQPMKALLGKEASPGVHEALKVPGIGPITISAFEATLGDAKTFKNGRQVTAWLGIVPKQSSSGGKERLLGISKRGDSYLRTLLIHGARSVIVANERRRGTPQENLWLSALIQRRNKNIAAVALASKNARTLWALLAHGSAYQADYKRPAAPA